MRANWKRAASTPPSPTPSTKTAPSPIRRRASRENASSTTRGEGARPHAPLAKEGDTLRARALHATSVTQWVPPSGQNRITGMIDSKPDWVISRLRAWGVPIAVFVREKGDGSAEILQDDA